MTSAATIVALITLIGSLVLVSRSSALARVNRAGLVRLALIWGAIILGVVLLIQVTGLRLAS